MQFRWIFGNKGVDRYSEPGAYSQALERPQRRHSARSITLPGLPIGLHQEEAWTWTTRSTTR
jgi:hypothetical protein